MSKAEMMSTITKPDMKRLVCARRATEVSKVKTVGFSMNFVEKHFEYKNIHKKTKINQ